MAMIPKNMLLKLIEAGIDAPSADNGQPWQFKLLDDGFELWFDKENMGLFFDVHSVATLMSCGAVIENIETMAQALGLQSSIDYSSQNTDHVATIRFIESETTNTEQQTLVEHKILNRHSDRNLFEFNRQVPDDILSTLAQTVETMPNYGVHFYQTPSEKKAITSIITATDTIRFIHRRIHNDFYHVLRFGDAAEKTRDGLASRTLGIEAFLIPMLRMFKPWWLTRLFNCVGLHHVMAFRGTWLPMKSASVIVSIIHNGPADYIELGRMMERFWIEANYLGLSVQALGALPLFMARMTLSNGEGFSAGQLKTLEKLILDFQIITPEHDKDTSQVVMLFRLGYSKHDSPKSYRRPVNSFIR